MRRNRDVRDGRITSNKNEQLSAILMRGEDKRRKIRPSYIEESLDRVVGKSLYEFQSGLMDHFPPSIGYPHPELPNQVPTGGTFVGPDEGAGAGGGTKDPSQWVTVEPGVGIKPDQLEFGTIEQPELKPGAPEKGGEGGGGILEDIPEPGFEGDNYLELTQSDVKVAKVKQPDGAYAYYAFNDNTKLWYQIKFINPLSEGQPFTFLMQGLLYYYNSQYDAWLYYNPPGNTAEAIYLTKMDIYPSGNTVEIVDDTGFHEILTKKPGEEYFWFKGAYYYLDVVNKALVPLQGTDSDTERQKLVYSIVTTYGLMAAQNFMYNNYDEYYSAWMAMFPTTPPISQANLDRNMEKMMALQWMMIQNGPEYVQKFLEQNEDWGIAWTLLNPKTTLSQGYMTQQIELYEAFQGMNDIQKQQFQNAFELSWLFDRQDVMNEFSNSITPLLDDYLNNLDRLQQSPQDPQLAELTHEAWANLLISALSFLSNKGGTLSALGGLATGLSLNQNMSFITLQIFRVISSYRYGVSFAPTMGGIIFQTIAELADMFQAVGSGQMGLGEGIRTLSVTQFVEKFSADIRDAMQFVHRVLTSIISTIRGTAQSSTIIATLGEEGVSINEAAFAEELFGEGAQFAEAGAEAAVEVGAEEVIVDEAVSFGIEAIAAGIGSVLSGLVGLSEIAGAVYLLYEIVNSSLTILYNSKKEAFWKDQQSELVKAQMGLQALSSYLTQYPDAFIGSGQMSVYSSILQNYQKYSDPYYLDSLQSE